METEQSKHHLSIESWPRRHGHRAIEEALSKGNCFYEKSSVHLLLVPQLSVCFHITPEELMKPWALGQSRALRALHCTELITAQTVQGTVEPELLYWQCKGEKGQNTVS